MTPMTIDWGGLCLSLDDAIEAKSEDEFRRFTEVDHFDGSTSPDRLYYDRYSIDPHECLIEVDEPRGVWKAACLDCGEAIVYEIERKL